MLNLQQKQSLQQKLSPQQIQYIKLLQLPTMALEQRIKAEMEINPLLEEGEELDENELDDPIEDAEETHDAEQSEKDADTRDEREERNEDDEFDWDEYLNSADDLYGYKARVDNSAEEEQREIPTPYRSTMSESLLDQLSFLNLSESEEAVAEQIIGSIDEDGYLRRPLDSIIDDIMFNQGVMVSETDVEKVLKKIQKQDPVGIAARDLRECAAPPPCCASAGG